MGSHAEVRRKALFRVATESRTRAVSQRALARRPGHGVSIDVGGDAVAGMTGDRNR